MFPPLPCGADLGSGPVPKRLGGRLVGASWRRQLDRAHLSTRRVQVKNDLHFGRCAATGQSALEAWRALEGYGRTAAPALRSCSDQRRRIVYISWSEPIASWRATDSGLGGQ